MSPTLRTVTSVEKQGRGVVAVIIDGDDRPALLPLESVILNRVHEGAEFATDAWEAIRAEGAVLLATRRGLELLSRKQQTERDLRTALGGDFRPGDIDRALERLHEKYPTGALAVLAVPGGSWRDLVPGTARLVEFTRPRDLAVT